MPDIEAVAGDKPASRFKSNVDMATKKDKSERAYLLVQGENDAVSIQGNHINRVFHAERVNPVTGIEPQNFIFGEGREREQSKGAFAGRVCDQDTPRKCFFGLPINEFE